MREKINWKKIKVKELAGLISHHLKEDGIEVVLVGGSCVTIYSNNRYLSHDLDYVSHEEFWRIVESLKKLGFVKKERHFEHSQCAFLIDFVTEPVAIGREIVKEFAELPTKYGVFKLLTVTDCVKDRLASFYYWSDRQGLDQAIDVSLDHKIDMQEIRKWSKSEGYASKFLLFEAELRKKTQERKEL